MEIDPPEDDRPDYMLSVYKNDLKQKRLNAVSLRKITDVTLCDTPCAFIVSVGENSYTLLARDNLDAETWVNTLNETRKAINEGASSDCLIS